MFSSQAVDAIERVLRRSGALYEIAKDAKFRATLECCLDSAWQKIEAGKPGSWHEDLPPVIIVAGPHLGFFLEEVLCVFGLTVEEIRKLEVSAAFSLRAWPRLIEATFGSARTETIYRA